MLTKNQVKYIQSLGQKKCRDEEQVFIAEGTRLAGEIMQDKKYRVRHIYAIKEWVEHHSGILSDKVTEIAPHELEKISQMKTPKEVLIICEKIKWDGEITLEDKITLLLDTIQDPGNLGTIIRTVDWFGISQVICSPECADLYNPKVVQSTMGSIGRVRVEYTDLRELLIKHSNFPSYAAVMDGEDIRGMKKIKEGLIIIGNEARGISSEILELTRIKIIVPGKGKAESLNAAIATGIILSHLTL